MHQDLPRIKAGSSSGGGCGPGEAESRHQCLIYDGSPSCQLPALAGALRHKMRDGFRCLYLNSQPMVAGMRSALASAGFDVERAVADGSLILSSELTVREDGAFDVAMMLSKLERALDQALSDGYRGLWATGDMTWEFGAERNLDKLMEYENRLEELVRTRPELCGVCQYHRDTLPAGLAGLALMTHRTLFVNESLSQHNPAYVPWTPGQGQKQRVA